MPSMTQVSWATSRASVAPGYQKHPFFVEDEELVRNYSYNIAENISVLQILHDNIPDKFDHDHK